MVFKSHNPKLFGYYVFNAYFQDFMIRKRSSSEFCRPIWWKSFISFFNYQKTLVKFSNWSHHIWRKEPVDKLYFRLNPNTPEAARAKTRLLHLGNVEKQPHPHFCATGVWGLRFQNHDILKFEFVSQILKFHIKSNFIVFVIFG